MESPHLVGFPLTPCAIATPLQARNDARTRACSRQHWQENRPGQPTCKYGVSLHFFQIRNTVTILGEGSGEKTDLNIEQ